MSGIKSIDNASTSRRQMLRTAACGFGGLALHSMTARSVAANALTARQPHFVPRAKRVIFLFVSGGPSQSDLFVEKPYISKRHGSEITPPYDGRHESNSSKFLAMKPIHPIRPRGQSGVMVSDLMPEFSSVIDDVCLLNATHTDNKAHGPASLQLHTGVFQGMRPSVGAWVSYGLGTENQDLPSFITIRPPTRDVRFYGSGFLPAAHQGTTFNVPTSNQSMAVRHLQDRNIESSEQLRRLSFTDRANQRLLKRFETDQQMEGMIESFELAFRMQAKTPELVDLSSESQETLDLYGVGSEPTDKNARSLLMARRLSEAGVRFVQVTIDGWDHHRVIKNNLPKSCAESDKPVAALLKDLKRRGLLDETLVVWSGEFGRPFWSQDLTYTASFERHGRGHQSESYSCWMAGGGIKGGLSYGETDDFGLYPTHDAVHLHDLHATVLHQLGLDHEDLTYRYAGRDFRLTDVYGKIVHDILV